MEHRFHILMDEPAIYRITVLGKLDGQVAYRLSNLQMGVEQNAEGQTISILSGQLQDQAALIGVLVQLYNRGHCLLAMERSQVAEA
jgi:hypothetical protein